MYCLVSRSWRETSSKATMVPKLFLGCKLFCECSTAFTFFHVSLHELFLYDELVLLVLLASLIYCLLYSCWFLLINNYCVWWCSVLLCISCCSISAFFVSVLVIVCRWVFNSISSSCSITPLLLYVVHSIVHIYNIIGSYLFIYYFYSFHILL